MISYNTLVRSGQSIITKQNYFLSKKLVIVFVTIIFPDLFFLCFDELVQLLLIIKWPCKYAIILIQLYKVFFENPTQTLPLRIEQLSFSFHLIVLPLTFILPSIFVDHISIAFSLIIFELTFIARSIQILHISISMSLVTLPLSFVFRSLTIIVLLNVRIVKLYSQHICLSLPSPCLLFFSYLVSYSPKQIVCLLNLTQIHSFLFFSLIFFNIFSVSVNACSISISISISVLQSIDDNDNDNQYTII